MPSILPVVNVQTLCAIRIPSSISTRKWIEERERCKKLIENFKPNVTVPGTPPADLAVNYIAYSSLTEPNNDAEIKLKLGREWEGTMS